jgi:hypothetical protein
MSQYPRKTPATPAGDLVKAQNVIVTDSEDDEVERVGTWVRVFDHRAIDLSYVYSETADDYLEFKFFGTGLWLRYFGLPDGGKADVSIDGGEAKELDTYSPAEGALMAFVASNLSPNKEHSVKITVKGTKRTVSDGFKVAVDSFIVELSRGSMQIWSMVEESLLTQTTLIPQPVQVRSIVGTSPILASPTAIVIFQDDFESSPLKWSAWQSTVKRDTSNPYSGGACGKCTCEPIAYKPGTMYRYFSRLLDERMGLELWFYAPETDTELVSFGIYMWTENMWYRGVVRYLFGERKWQYEDENGVFQDIPGGAKPIYRPAYVHLKLTVDFPNLRYGWLNVMNCKFDLRSYKLNGVVNPTEPHLGVDIGISSLVNASKSIYIDDVLVTNYEVI